MKSGKELLLQAARNELKRLHVLAEKAKKEVDEYMEAPGVMFALHRELAEIVNAGSYDKVSLQKLADLDRRHKAAVKVNKKDLGKLLDKQFDAEQMCRDLEIEIGNLEFMFGMWKRKKDETG